MKVYIKFLLFLSVSLCLFGLLALHVIRTSEEDVLQVQNDMEQREGIVIDNIIALKRSNMGTFAWDYSWWQDLIDWIDAPDMEWLRDQFDQTLYTYDVGFFIVYDASGKRVSPVLGPDLIALDIEFPDQLSAEILKRPTAVLYEASFERHPDGLLEVYHAPIVPQEDIDRSGKHYGYLVVGRFWDDDYLGALESVTGAQMRLLEVPLLDQTEVLDTVWTGTMQLELPLTNFNGELQGVLLITKSLPVSKRILDEQAEALRLLLSVAIFAILSLVLFVLWSVTRPLHRLSKAMESGNVEALSRYGKGQSEFKHLAELIIENYAQQERLEAEVARRRETEAALMHSRDLVECASRAKSQFLANMSHETRTPLHTISGYASLLEDSNLNDEQKQSLAYIRRSSDRLVRMLTDIIELSSIEAAEMHPQNSWFVLEHLFDELAGAGEALCAEPSITFKSEFGDGCPVMVYLDYECLKRLLLNLVDNAVKFTHSGTVALRCHYSEAQGQHRICFEVEDTGIGIPQDELDRIFEAFYLVDDSDSRQHQGGGLGLAIARGLSGVLQTQLEVDSIPGVGSVFRLVVLLDPEHVRFKLEQVDSGPVP